MRYKCKRKHTRQIRLELDEIQKINHHAGKSGVMR